MSLQDIKCNGVELVKHYNFVLNRSREIYGKRPKTYRVPSFNAKVESLRDASDQLTRLPHAVVPPPHASIAAARSCLISDTSKLLGLCEDTLDELVKEFLQPTPSKWNWGKYNRYMLRLTCELPKYARELKCEEHILTNALEVLQIFLPGPDGRTELSVLKSRAAAVEERLLPSMSVEHREVLRGQIWGRIPPLSRELALQSRDCLRSLSLVVTTIRDVYTGWEPDSVEEQTSRQSLATGLAIMGDNEHEDPSAFESRLPTEIETIDTNLGSRTSIDAVQTNSPGDYSPEQDFSRDNSPGASSSSSAIADPPGQVGHSLPDHVPYHVFARDDELLVVPENAVPDTYLGDIWKIRITAQKYYNEGRYEEARIGFLEVLSRSEVLFDEAKHLLKLDEVKVQCADAQMGQGKMDEADESLQGFDTTMVDVTIGRPALYALFLSAQISRHKGEYQRADQIVTAIMETWLEALEGQPQAIDALYSMKVDLNSRMNLGHNGPGRRTTIETLLSDTQQILDNLQNGRPVVMSQHLDTLISVVRQSGSSRTIVSDILDKEPDVAKLSNRYHDNLLQASIEANNHGLVLRLIHLGANVTEFRPDTYTPLHYAASCASSAIIDTLVNYGAQIDLNFPWQGTPLNHAIKMGNLEAAKRLLERGANPHIASNDGMLPIHGIVGSSDNLALEILQLLISKNAKVSAQRKDGQTALHLAIGPSPNPGKQIDLISVLMHNKADVYIQDNNGFCAIDLASRLPFDGILICLLSYPACSVDGLSPDGKRALIRAIGSGDADSVRRLLRHKASPTKLEDEEESPIQLALQSRCKEISEALLSKGAHATGFDVLLPAIEMDLETLVKRALDRGASPNDRNLEGVPFLFIAMLHGNEKIVDALLDCGADANGALPRTREVKGPSVLQHGCTPEYTLLEGTTALHLAVELRSAPLLRSLLQRGANVELENINGRTPLDLAIHQGNCDQLVRILEMYKPEPPQLAPAARSRLTFIGLRHSLSLRRTRTKGSCQSLSGSGVVAQPSGH